MSKFTIVVEQPPTLKDWLRWSYVAGFFASSREENGDVHDVVATEERIRKDFDQWFAYHKELLEVKNKK